MQPNGSVVALGWLICVAKFQTGLQDSVWLHLLFRRLGDFKHPWPRALLYCCSFKETSEVILNGFILAIDLFNKMWCESATGTEAVFKTSWVAPNSAFTLLQERVRCDLKSLKNRLQAIIVQLWAFRARRTAWDRGRKLAYGIGRGGWSDRTRGGDSFAIGKFAKMSSRLTMAFLSLSSVEGFAATLCLNEKCVKCV